MIDYVPPYTISNRMPELVSDISEKAGKIGSHKELTSRPRLRRNNRIRSIHSSLRIEANYLSFSQVRDVINDQLDKRTIIMGEVMEYDIPYTSNAIMETLGLKSKEMLRKNYINPTIELGVIRMTLPDYAGDILHDFSDMPSC